MLGCQGRGALFLVAFWRYEISGEMDLKILKNKVFIWLSVIAVPIGIVAAADQFTNGWVRTLLLSLWSVVSDTLLNVPEGGSVASQIALLIIIPLAMVQKVAMQKLEKQRDHHAEEVQSANKNLNDSKNNIRTLEAKIAALAEDGNKSKAIFVSNIKIHHVLVRKLRTYHYKIYNSMREKVVSAERCNSEQHINTVRSNFVKEIEDLLKEFSVGVANAIKKLAEDDFEARSIDDSVYVNILLLIPKPAQADRDAASKVEISMVDRANIYETRVTRFAFDDEFKRELESNKVIDDDESLCVIQQCTALRAIDETRDSCFVCNNIKEFRELTYYSSIWGKAEHDLKINAKMALPVRYQPNGKDKNSAFLMGFVVLLSRNGNNVIELFSKNEDSPVYNHASLCADLLASALFSSHDIGSRFEIAANCQLGKIKANRRQSDRTKP